MMIANPGNAFAQGFSSGSQMMEQRRQNKLADLYRTQGAGIASGDPNALNALAQFDPMAVRDMRRQDVADQRAAEQFGMTKESHGLGMQIDRERLAQMREQGKRQAAEHAANMSTAEREAEARQLAGIVAGGVAAWQQGPDAFAAYVQSNGEDPAKYTYEAFPALAAGMIGAAEGLKEGISAAESFAPKRLEFRTITGDDAKAMGLDPSKAYNVGEDGKVTQIGGGGVTVNAAPQVGSIPQGWELFQDQQSGAYQMRPIKGGPEDKTVFNERAREAKQTQADIVLDEIGIAKDLVKNQSIFSPTTGVTGSLASRIDSTDAGALKNRLATIKANIGFDKLQAMRDASPTGGALGQVSEFENRLLQAVFGSLEQAQKGEDLLYNLDRLESIYNRIINEGIPEDEARKMYREIVSGGRSAKAPDAAPDVAPDYLSKQDADLWDYFTPEQRAAILKEYEKNR